MAVEFGKMDLGEEIRGCKHAGVAKQLGKNIAEDHKRWEWEEKNFDLMKVLLDAKAEQCPEFRQCLLENTDKVFAEATPSKFWGTGMTLNDTELTSSEYWPGKNMLGALITDLASYVLTKNTEDTENTMAFEDEQSTQDHDQDLIPDTLDTNSPADRDDDETIMAHKPTLKSREMSISGSPSASLLVSGQPSEAPVIESPLQNQHLHQDTSPRKKSLSKGTTPRSRQSSLVTQHSRARSQSLSNPHRKTRQSDQDIRTAFCKRKNPETSPDEKCSARDKMHKSTSGLGIS